MMTTSAKGEKIQSIVRESLFAPEEFLKDQSTQESQERQQNNEPEVVQGSQSLKEDLPEKEDQGKFPVTQPVRKEKEEMNTGNVPQEDEGVAGEMLETTEDSKEPNLKEQMAMTQLPLIRPVPLEADKTILVHGPGPLITEMEDKEWLETIHLPLQRTLFTDDLPDLEDVDTEEFTTMFSPHQVSKPKIEIISGGTDDDETPGNQIESIPTFGTHKNSLFLPSSSKPTAVYSKSSSLVYPEDENTHQPCIIEPVGESKSGNTSSQPCYLIEELE